MMRGSGRITAHAVIDEARRSRTRREVPLLLLADILGNCSSPLKSRCAQMRESEP